MLLGFVAGQHDHLFRRPQLSCQQSMNQLLAQRTGAARDENGLVLENHGALSVM